MKQNLNLLFLLIYLFTDFEKVSGPSFYDELIMANFEEMRPHFPHCTHKEVCKA